LQNFSSPVIDGIIGKRQELLPNFAILLSFDLGQQDVDECALGTDECEYLCADGWCVSTSFVFGVCWMEFFFLSLFFQFV
jgi:hypothetical protein